MNRNLLHIILVILGIFSCKDEDQSINNDTSLATLVAQNKVKIDNVIACASGSADKNTITAYVYPRSEATDIRYFETNTVQDDKNKYQNYEEVSIVPTNFFNGYLKKFTRTINQEKWVIITFFENDSLHLSNPIRLKHLSKPTEFTDQVTVDNEMRAMPRFGWNDGIYKDNTIYFQVLSDQSGDFLSGTYTFETQFQYYKLDNVVLNITRETPPDLQPETLYNFTLMGVSEDNWVFVYIIVSI